jgi:hypothetical protein
MDAFPFGSSDPSAPSPKELPMATHLVPRLYRQFSLTCALVLLFQLGLGSVHPSSAQVGFVSPVLTSVVASEVQSRDNMDSVTTQILVSGVGFSPGEPVFIAIHDQWATVQHETRWVIASMPVLQPPQDLDPGEGFSVDPGGNIGEFFEIPVTTLPGGGQPPVLGEVASQSVTMAGGVCATSLMVQAYDRLSATWSNLVEVNLGC